MLRRRRIIAETRYPLEYQIVCDVKTSMTGSIYVYNRQLIYLKNVIYLQLQVLKYNYTKIPSNDYLFVHRSPTR
jgi:hypothetical protein